MKMLKNQKPLNKKERRLRRALLAKIHIAKKELGLADDLYRELLIEHFGVDTAAALPIEELGKLVEFFKEHGWNEKASERSRVKAMQVRCALYRKYIGEKRFRGLCEKFLGVSDPRWCQDLEKLRRACAVLHKIMKEEAKNEHG